MFKNRIGAAGRLYSCSRRTVDRTKPHINRGSPEKRFILYRVQERIASIAYVSKTHFFRQQSANKQSLARGLLKMYASRRKSWRPRTLRSESRVKGELQVFIFKCPASGCVLNISCLRSYTTLVCVVRLHASDLKHKLFTCVLLYERIGIILCSLRWQHFKTQ